eukprot:8291452-Ditylum_brightwellii.AAC.1
MHDSNSDHVQLLSVTFDGISAEDVMSQDVMMKFLEGKQKIVEMVDPNHVGKTLCSQLVLDNVALQLCSVEMVNKIAAINEQEGRDQ